MLTKQGKLGLIVCVPLMIGLSACLNSNPFQKNINKSIYVVEYADSASGNVGGSYGDEALLQRCLKEPQTISSQKLQELFSSGVKTISVQPWKNDREYVSLLLFGVCGGQSYVLEGPENLLNNL